jgi:rfaE bifunctional protein nucleotidyltransferase chain/domain
MRKIDYIQSKILELPELKKKIAAARMKNARIVFTNGCFDILHLGHVTYLAEAADLGSFLVVGLNSDESLKTLGKGSSRPIQDQHSRAEIMASLHVVDAVVIFNEETPLNLIKEIEPDVLVKGGDWKIEDIVGNDIVQQKGGVVTTIELVQGYSTTAIEQKIKGGKS